LKCWLLFGDADCRRLWRESGAAVNKYLADEVGAELWSGHADMRTGRRTATMYGALDAFFPAVLALSGDLPRARRLQASSFKMWRRHGVEPEELNYKTMEIGDAGYPLRPEIMESAYTLYVKTKDPRYLDMGRTFFDALARHTRAGSAYTTLKNVETKKKGDLMPSYFLAETLKYLYLLYAPPETLPFDDIVFNTEAHPFRRRR
jgi:mannosidase alpha-like ER degradation enhancer 2